MADFLTNPSTPTFEQQLALDPRWAMSEGSLFFEGQGRVQKTLIAITRRLNELQIPYAVAGGMALFAHGFRRFTEDVDILVTPDGLDRLHEALDGLGYVRPFAMSKNLRNTETGVKIEFLLTGGFPGDGKPKPVAFPDPNQVATAIGDVRCLTLPTLIELKLASGMTAPSRLKDLADVQELIRMLHLPSTFGDQLDPYVRMKFDELWKSVEVDPEESP
jgi:hypothetical protein